MVNKKILLKIIVVVIMIIILLYLLVWAGTIRCNSLPGMCSMYWGTQTLFTGKQQPSIVIVYDPADTEGIGNPYLLERTIKDNKIIGYNVRLENINHISEEKIRKDALLIVNRARKISTPKLEMFINYVSKGGRLIWIGDAGVEIEGSGDTLLTLGDIQGTFDGNVVNGWARLNSDNYMIRFDEFLGVEYINNYCKVKQCEDKIYPVAGGLQLPFKRPIANNGVLVPTSDHRIVYGLRDYLEVRDDFSIVQLTKPMTNPLKLDYGSKLYLDDKTFVGSENGVFPLIVLSNSNKVAYYALPPEYLIEDDDEQKYMSIIENMMYGMLR